VGFARQAGRAVGAVGADGERRRAAHLASLEPPCALVGGHTAEGRELALGFAVNGHTRPDGKFLSKAGMRPGCVVLVRRADERWHLGLTASARCSDALVLTKRLGTGVLLAGHMRVRAKGAWVARATRQMLVSNQRAGQVFLAFAASSCTDVTGFGLAGHLVEMVRATLRGGGAQVVACLDLRAVPALEGALELFCLGVQSSLQRENEKALGLVKQLGPGAALVLKLLCDPQTAGGLLASVRAEVADECVLALRRAGYEDACVVGRVREGALAGGELIEASSAA
jgi:selenide,water dikinase